ncbi:unnamed protein product [Gongylonema pulchrum]|uniref:Uroplakin-3b n=1 Tax=Gongylonema pulchrum TaxID=637853 RepID=A0A183E9U4_9BILA|nr:unnamed protein product [Gongylonema pulchrum]
MEWPRMILIGVLMKSIHRLFGALNPRTSMDNTAFLELCPGRCKDGPNLASRAGFWTYIACGPAGVLNLHPGLQLRWPGYAEGIFMGLRHSWIYAQVDGEFWSSPGRGFTNDAFCISCRTLDLQKSCTRSPRLLDPYPDLNLHTGQETPKHLRGAVAFLDLCPGDPETSAPGYGISGSMPRLMLNLVVTERLPRCQHIVANGVVRCRLQVWVNFHSTKFHSASTIPGCGTSGSIYAQVDIGE